MRDKSTYVSKRCVCGSIFLLISIIGIIVSGYVIIHSPQIVKSSCIVVNKTYTGSEFQTLIQNNTCGPTINYHSSYTVRQIGSKIIGELCNNIEPEYTCCINDTLYCHHIIKKYDGSCKPFITPNLAVYEIMNIGRIVTCWIVDSTYIYLSDESLNEMGTLFEYVTLLFCFTFIVNLCWLISLLDYIDQDEDNDKYLEIKYWE